MNRLILILMLLACVSVSTARAQSVTNKIRQVRHQQGVRDIALKMRLEEEALRQQRQAIQTQEALTKAAPSPPTQTITVRETLQALSQSAGVPIILYGVDAEHLNATLATTWTSGHSIHQVLLELLPAIAPEDQRLVLDPRPGHIRLSTPEDAAHTAIAKIFELKHTLDRCSNQNALAVRGYRLAGHDTATAILDRLMPLITIERPDGTDHEDQQRAITALTDWMQQHLEPERWIGKPRPEIEVRTKDLRMVMRAPSHLLFALDGRVPVGMPDPKQFEDDAALFGAVGFDPTVSVANDGALLDVQGTVSGDGRYIGLTTGASSATVTTPIRRVPVGAVSR